MQSMYDNPAKSGQNFLCNFRIGNG
jgi:hypothetical protein